MIDGGLIRDGTITINYFIYLQTHIMWTSYLWEIKNGLNLDHSFDRVYYHNKIDDNNSLFNERQNALKKFKETKKTRLVFNVIIDANVKIDNSQFAPWEIESNFPFPRWTVNEWYRNVIIWYNKEVRNIDKEQKKIIQTRILNTLNVWPKTIQKTEETRNDLVENLNNDERVFYENIKRIEQIKEQWYVYTTKPNPEILASLWKDTFWWDVETVKKELDVKKNLILSLEDKDWNIISAWMLAENWESTEWITNPIYQWKWMIQPLLFVLHSYGIKKMKQNGKIHTITAEARFDRSISPGKKVWMKIHWISGNEWIIEKEDDIWVHINHVTIWWEANQDDRNINKDEDVNWLNFKDLRSFVTMFLPEYYYDDSKIEKVLNIAKIKD